jgi:hypothetical protein
VGKRLWPPKLRTQSGEGARSGKQKGKDKGTRLRPVLLATYLKTGIQMSSLIDCCWPFTA